MSQHCQQTIQPIMWYVNTVLYKLRVTYIDTI